MPDLTEERTLPTISDGDMFSNLPEVIGPSLIDPHEDVREPLRKISGDIFDEGELFDTIDEKHLDSVIPEGAFADESMLSGLEDADLSIIDPREDITEPASEAIDNIGDTDVDFGLDRDIAPERLDNATDRLSNVLDSGFDSTDFGLEKAFHNSRSIREMITQIGRQDPNPFDEINTSRKDVMEGIKKSSGEFSFGVTTEEINERFKEMSDSADSVSGPLDKIDTVGEDVKETVGSIRFRDTNFGKANDELGDVNKRLYTMERLSMNVNAAIEGFFGQAERIPMLADDLDGLGEQVRNTLGVSMIQGIDNVEDVEEAMEGLSEETDLTDDELEELGDELEQFSTTQ
jgi:hypothetical protein